MPKLIENGYVYLAQPPLYKVTRKQREEYIDSDDQLTHKLLLLGTDDMTVETADGRTFTGDELRSLLELLVEIEGTLQAISRRGVNPIENVLKHRKSETGEFPRYIIILGHGDDERFRYGYSDADLSHLRQEAETELQSGPIDMGTTQIQAYHRTQQVQFRWMEMYHTGMLRKEIDTLIGRGFTIDNYIGTGEPVAHIVEDDEKIPVNNLQDLLNVVRERGRKGVSIQRYKGLGEMNEDQLYDTTMDPAKRRLLRVQMEDAVRADAIFSLLMGDDVEPRRKFIEDNALNVRNLDI
ncbi:MAG: hypothetical protein J6334_00230 [Kiritimatiellae bacterium]|nr:hypothetical protein [Kiritimatiellia bacterium]